MRALVVALPVIAACSGAPAIDVTYDPCSPLLVATNSQSLPGEVEAIEGALAMWSQVLPTQIELRGQVDELDDRPVLPIDFESGDTFYRAMYWDAWGEISISREKLAPEDYDIAIAHEMGHAFGLWHVAVDDRSSVMNEGNLDILPTADDAADVRGLWPACDHP